MTAGSEHESDLSRELDKADRRIRINQLKEEAIRPRPPPAPAADVERTSKPLRRKGNPNRFHIVLTVLLVSDRLEA